MDMPAPEILAATRLSQFGVRTVDGTSLSSSMMDGAISAALGTGALEQFVGVSSVSATKMRSASAGSLTFGSTRHRQRHGAGARRRGSRHRRCSEFGPLVGAPSTPREGPERLGRRFPGQHVPHTGLRLPLRDPVALWAADELWGALGLRMNCAKFLHPPASVCVRPPPQSLPTDSDARPTSLESLASGSRCRSTMTALTSSSPAARTSSGRRSQKVRLLQDLPTCLRHAVLWGRRW